MKDDALTRQQVPPDDPTDNAAVGPTLCSDCGELVHPSDTVCAGCGTHLSPRTSSDPGRSSLDGMCAAGVGRRTIPMVTDSTTTEVDPHCGVGILAALDELDSEPSAVESRANVEAFFQGELGRALRLVEEASVPDNVVQLHSVKIEDAS